MPFTTATPFTPRITVLGGGDADEVVALIVAAQLDPSRHVVYAGTTQVAVAGDLSSAED